MNQADDGDRLIQEVLTELGWDAAPKEIAEKVRRLDLGLPAEDEFTAICSWLGKASLVHKLDQQQAPLESRDAYQVPDLLAHFDNAGPLLVEVKSRAGWPRAVTHPRLPRIRACPIRAPGSSDNGLAAQRYTLCTTRTGGRG